MGDSTSLLRTGTSGSARHFFSSFVCVRRGHLCLVDLANATNARADAGMSFRVLPHDVVEYANCGIDFVGSLHDVL